MGRLLPLFMMRKSVTQAGFEPSKPLICLKKSCANTIVIIYTASNVGKLRPICDN